VTPDTSGSLICVSVSVCAFGLIFLFVFNEGLFTSAGGVKGIRLKV
jgi:hypothetical protein